jgi:Heterokaryon incompatibility protein (HET)
MRYPGGRGRTRKQVLRMRTTLARAQQTNLWLGAEEDTDEDALRCIKLMVENYPRSGPDIPTLREALSQVNQKPFLLDGSNRGYISAELWQALTLFLSRPWFSRMWVFHEVAISSRLSLSGVASER